MWKKSFADPSYRPRRTATNSCGCPWRHFLGYSLTYCVFISSGQGPIAAPTMDKCCFCQEFSPSEQLSTIPPAVFCSATPSKCMSAVRAERNSFKMRDSFHYSEQPTLDMLEKNVFSQDAPLCNGLKQDTPLCRVYIMHTSLESGSDAFQNISQFLVIQWLIDAFWMCPKIGF